MEDNLTTFTIRNFPKSLHRRAKIQAAVDSISLKDLVIKAVTEYLERQKKGGEPSY